MRLCSSTKASTRPSLPPMLEYVAPIARKVSCGNKTEAGTSAWERLTSLAMTCQQRCQDFASWLAGCLPLDAPVTPIPAAIPTR